VSSIVERYNEISPEAILERRRRRKKSRWWFGGEQERGERAEGQSGLSVSSLADLPERGLDLKRLGSEVG